MRHWHVDYLLGHAETRLATDVRSPGVDAECTVASRIADGAEPVTGVGATDCACEAHLAYAVDVGSLAETVRRAHDLARRQ